MAMTPSSPGAGRRTVELYNNTLGQALRGAGRTEFGAGYDTIPLVYTVSLPTDAAAEFDQNLLLRNQLVLELSPIVQDHVRRYVAPMLTPGEKVAGLPQRLEAIFRARLPDIQPRIDAIFVRHSEAAKRWSATRKGNIQEFAIIGVTLSLSVIATGLSVPAMGVPMAAAVLGIVRGLIDGAKLFVECWRTADEQHAIVIRHITRLTEAYHAGTAQGRTMQLGGAVAGTIGLTKIPQILGRSDGLPTMKVINEGMELYRGKLGHLYCYTGMLANELEKLLQNINAMGGTRPGTALSKLERSVSDLLTTGTTGKSHGFRGRFTISEGYRRYESGLRGLDAADAFLADLVKLERNPKLMAGAVQATALLTNAGLALMNYSDALHLSSHASAQEVGEALGVLQDGKLQPVTAVTAAAMGWFNDGFGTAKDTSDLFAEIGSPEAEAQAARIAQDVRLKFATPPAVPPTSKAPILPDLDFGPDMAPMFSL